MADCRVKTQKEIEDMKDEVQKNIDEYGELARAYNKDRNQDLYEYYEKLYGKEVAKYNILLEVLR